MRQYKAAKLLKQVLLSCGSLIELIPARTTQSEESSCHSELREREFDRTHSRKNDSTRRISVLEKDTSLTLSMTRFKKTHSMSRFTFAPGFSLVEVMILFAILSVILAASMPMITRKSHPVPQRFGHGVYRCISDGYKADGVTPKYIEERYNSTQRISGGSVDECRFDVPLAPMYKIDLYSGGTGGTKYASIKSYLKDGAKGTYYFDGSTSSKDVFAQTIVSEITDEQMAQAFGGAEVISSMVTGNAGQGGDGLVEGYMTPVYYRCKGEAEALEAATIDYNEKKDAYDELVQDYNAELSRLEGLRDNQQDKIDKKEKEKAKYQANIASYTAAEYVDMALGFYSNWKDKYDGYCRSVFDSMCYFKSVLNSTQNTLSEYMFRFDTNIYNVEIGQNPKGGSNVFQGGQDDSDYRKPGLPFPYPEGPFAYYETAYRWAFLSSKGEYKSLITNETPGGGGGFTVFCSTKVKEYETAMNKNNTSGTSIKLSNNFCGEADAQTANARYYLAQQRENISNKYNIDSGTGRIYTNLATMLDKERALYTVAQEDKEFKDRLKEKVEEDADYQSKLAATNDDLTNLQKLQAQYDEYCKGVITYETYLLCPKLAGQLSTANKDYNTKLKASNDAYDAALQNLLKANKTAAENLYNDYARVYKERNDILEALLKDIPDAITSVQNFKTGYLNPYLDSIDVNAEMDGYKGAVLDLKTMSKSKEDIEKEIDELNTQFKDVDEPAARKIRDDAYSVWFRYNNGNLGQTFKKSNNLGGQYSQNDMINTNVLHQMMDYCKATYWEYYQNNDDGLSYTPIGEYPEGEYTSNSANYIFGDVTKAGSVSSSQGEQGGKGEKYARIKIQLSSDPGMNYKAYLNTLFGISGGLAIRPAICEHSEENESIVNCSIAHNTNLKGINEDIKSISKSGGTQSAGFNYKDGEEKSNFKGKNGTYTLQTIQGGNLNKQAAWYVPGLVSNDDTKVYFSPVEYIYKGAQGNAKGGVAIGGAGAGIHIDEYAGGGYEPPSPPENKSYTNMSTWTKDELGKFIATLLSQNYADKVYEKARPKTAISTTYKTITLNNGVVQIDGLAGGSSSKSNPLIKYPQMDISSKMWAKKYTLGNPGLKGKMESMIRTSLGKQCYFTVPGPGKEIDEYKLLGYDEEETKQYFNILQEKTALEMRCYEKASTNGEESGASEALPPYTLNGGSYEAAYGKTELKDKLFEWNKDTNLKEFKVSASNPDNPSWKATSAWARVFKKMTGSNGYYDLNSYRVGYPGKGTELKDSCTKGKGEYSISHSTTVKYMQGNKLTSATIDKEELKTGIQSENFDGFRDDVDCYGQPDEDGDGTTSELFINPNDSKQKQYFKFNDESERRGGGGAVVITW